MPNSDILIKIMAMNYAKQELQNGARDVQKFGKAISDVDGKAVSLTGSLKSIGVAAGITFSVGSIIAFGKEAFNTSLQVERILKPIEAIEEFNAPVALKYLHDEADRLGQNFYDLAASWGQVSAAAKGTVLQGEPLQRIFSSINETAVALAKSGGDVNGMFYAIMQMISKGRVSAEELRRQLGDRLPGAFQLAAEAMGVSTSQLDKMLQKGELLAVDLLPKLADVLHDRYGKAAIESASESQKAVNKFNEAWTDLKSNLVNSDLAVEGINAVTAAVKGLNETIRDMPTWEHLDNALANVPEQLARINEELDKIDRDDPAARRRASMRKSFGRGAPGAVPYGQTGTTDLLQAQKKYFEDVAEMLYAARRSLSAMAASNRPADIIDEGSEAKSQKFADALKRIRDELKLVGKEGQALELAKLDQWFEAEAETLGKTNAELVKLFEARKAAIQTKYENNFAEELQKIRTELELFGLEGEQLDLKKLDQWFAEKAETFGADNEQLKALYEARKSIIEKTFDQKAEDRARGFREELALIGVEGKALAQVKLDQWMSKLKRETGEVTPEMQALYDAQKRIIDEQYKWEESGPLGGIGKGFEAFANKGKDGFETLADAAEDAADRTNSALNDAIWDAESNWSDAVRSMAKEWSAMALRKSITEPGFELMSGFLTSFFHDGGVVGAKKGTTLVPSDTFNGARRYHGGGPVLGAGEVPIIAKARELILNEAQQKNVAAGLGGTNVSVNLFNNSDAEVSVEQSTDAAGNVNLDFILDRKIAGLATRPGSYTRRALGVKPAPVARR